MYALAHKKSHQPTLARKRSGPSHGNLEQSPQVRNVLARHRLQAKLRIGAPNDKYEREADRVADQVMRMPSPQLQPENENQLIQTKQLSAQITPLMQRQVGNPEEEMDEEELLQGKPIPGQSISIAPDFAEAIRGALPLLQRT